MKRSEILGRDFYGKPLYVGSDVVISDPYGRRYEGCKEVFTVTGPGKILNLDELGYLFFVKIKSDRGHEDEKLDRWLIKL